MAHRNGEIPLADLTVTSIGVRLRADAAASVERMAPRFRREVGHALLASDGYRAKAGAFGQVAIFEDRYPSLTSLGVNDRRGPWVRTSHPTLGARWWYRRRGAAAAAVPGTSNHGWAVACDFASGINAAGTPAHRWMNEHGPEYGWIWPAWAQKHPTFEPWHREYHPDRDVHRVASGIDTSTGLRPAPPIAAPIIAPPVVPDVQEDEPMFRIRVSAGITDPTQAGDVYLVQFGPQGQAMFKHLTPQQDAVCDIAGIPKKDVTQGVKDIVRLEVIQLEAAWKVN